MSAGDITQGRRVPDNTKRYGEDSGVRAGDYGRTLCDGDWTWWCRTPRGFGGNLTHHEILEHEDGTITVSPSILVTTPNHPDPVKAAGWHGYLELGVWREV